MNGIVAVTEIGEIKLDRLNKVLAGIPGGVMSAAHNALKRAGDRAKTEAGRYAAEEYAITKSSFMKNVETRTEVQGTGFGGESARVSATGSITSLNVTFRGSVIPLIQFKTRVTEGGTLTAQVKRGGGGDLPRAFISKMQSGHTGVFERSGKPRLPIEEKFGPSAAHMLDNETVAEKMTETVRETFDTRIEHEIWRLLSGTGR